ncbi:LHFPL tetraspan subfamily member 5 protein [Rhincodon typus]|uniref:LHFPL tetraspan subfamily member 5 protein n=1 Tax=Rhincodon typus TaxID=259920 RepID=UPI002030DAAD|nr:LHFPL tetraspan subfamily member 5 protein [Rhincodon typus]
MMLTAQEVAPLYQTDFVRNARAVTALWAVCTLCLALLEVVVLTEPAWVQAPASGPGPTGTFGLFQLCQQTDGPPRCQGSLAALSPVPSFQTPAGFVGAALGLVLASVCCSLGLYRCCSPSTVYKVCAWLQFSAASSQTLGCVTFPDSWGMPEVRELCGPQAGSYALGGCTIHWAFGLAILGVLDALVLSVLAFMLANRQETLLPENVERGQKVRQYTRCTDCNPDPRRIRRTAEAIRNRQRPGKMCRGWEELLLDSSKQKLK